MQRMVILLSRSGCDQPPSVSRTGVSAVTLPSRNVCPARHSPSACTSTSGIAKTATFFSFGFFDADTAAVPPHLDCMADGDRRMLQIDIAPLQRAEFAASKARRSGEQEVEREIAIVPCACEL